MTSIIQEYINLKWEIIPIRPEEKIPYVEYAKYKETNIEESEILGWLAKFDAADWAVLTGKNNRVLLDFDDPNIYDKYFSDIITKKVMLTPSGGISCIVNSTTVPRSCTKFNGFAFDIKGPGSYAVVPSQDLTEAQLADELEKEKSAEALISGEPKDKVKFIRRWLNFDETSDDEFEDIEKLLADRLPKIEPDVKKMKGTPSAIDWAKSHGVPIKYEGHGYVQVNCFLNGHMGEITRPNLTIYDNGYHCFSCLTPDQEIITIDGLKKAKDVIVGDKIIDGSGTIQKVVKTNSHPYNQSVKEIRTYSCNRPLSVTSNHSIYAVRDIGCEMRETKIACTPDCAAINKNRHKCSPDHWKFNSYKIEKIDAGELKIGDALVYPILKDAFGERGSHLDVYNLSVNNGMGPRNKKIDKLPLDEDAMWVYGLFLAEGSLYRGGIRFSLHGDEIDFAERVKSVFERIGCHVNIFKTKNSNGLGVTISKTDVEHIFEKLFGRGCENKRIPPEFLTLSREQQYALFDGIYSGDGGKGLKRKVITIASKTLAVQMFYMAINFKLFPSFSYRPQKINKKLTYTVYFTETEGKTSSRGRVFSAIDGVEYYIVPVEDIKTVDYCGTVYDITVSGEHHSYVTPQGLVGNCGQSGGLFKLIKEFTGKTEEEIRNEFPDIKKAKKTVTDKAIQIIEDKCDLVRDHNNNSFLKLKDYSRMGINLLPANSKVTRYWISSTIEEETERFPTASTLAYVMQHLDAKASAMGDKAKIFRRIGGDMEAIWYDIGGNNFVKITKDTFGIYPDTALTFMRETNEGVQNLPTNRRPEDVMRLFDVVNVPDRFQQILILTWLVNCFLPWAQYPILLLCGSRGSGKSWLARILKRLVDPVEGNASELLVNKPRDVNYLIHLLSHNACAVLDNLSFIDTEMSDVLCQVVTGGVMPTRQLYTTNDSVLIDIKSRLIITAINKEIFESGTGDLAERTIAIEIDRPEGKYVTEESLNEDFDSVRSDILGGILAIVQGYLKNGIPKKGEASEFRMTTYASVGKYVAEAVGTHLDFSRAYRTNQLGMSRNSLEAEPITDFILWYVEKHGGECVCCTPIEGWGVEKKLLFDKYFNEWIGEKQIYGDKKLPKNAGKLLSKMKRIAPDLLKIYKIEVRNMGLHKSKDWVMIRKMPSGPLNPNPAPSENSEEEERLVLGDDEEVEVQGVAYIEATPKAEVVCYVNTEQSKIIVGEEGEW